MTPTTGVTTGAAGPAMAVIASDRPPEAAKGPTTFMTAALLIAAAPTVTPPARPRTTALKRFSATHFSPIFVISQIMLSTALMRVEMLPKHLAISS